MITIIAGARPNFMKIAPIISELKKNDIPFQLVHTGQHYDHAMSTSFFDQLNIPKPNINLQCGGGSQAQQTSSIMLRFEEYLQSIQSSLVLVVGDVTSTMACTIVSKKLNIPVAHVEAGIRSGDMSMPEEINRIVTDSICDYFFTTTIQAGHQLIREGVNSEKIYFVGNTMIDTLLQNMSRLIKPIFYDSFKLKIGEYFVLTMHRPSNVDNPSTLSKWLESISNGTNGFPVIFPIHPRTLKIIKDHSIDTKNIICVDPLTYLEFIYLIKNSKGIITDSGGITEEATVLRIPCITLRSTTERPETVTIGTNVLVGNDFQLLNEKLDILLKGNWKKSEIPLFWDGSSANRIVSILKDLC